MTVPANARLPLCAALLIVSFGLVLLAIDPGFFWRDDFQSQQLAGYLDAARAWRNGELPLVSPSSWHAGALAGEYQNAVFSPAVMLPVILLAECNATLSTIAACLSLSHLVILSLGCCFLARRRRLPNDLCLLVAVVSTLNGYQLVWGAMCWFPELASFAWVPWAWWALERAVRRPGPLAWLLPGLFLALILLAGWPFSVLMIGLVTVMIALRSCLRKGKRWRLGPVLLAWVAGLGLSAPAWLSLVEFNRWTARGQVPVLSFQHDWLLSPRHLPALLFPGYRTPLDQESGPASSFNAELLGGLVPLIVLLAARWGYGTWRFFGRFRGEAALAAFVGFLSLLPSLGPFRWSFRWLALIFLAGGLASAGVLDRLRRQPPLSGLPNLGLWALAGCGSVWLAALARQLDPTPFTLTLGLVTVGLLLAWSAVERWWSANSPVRRYAPALVTWATALFFAVNMPPLLQTPSWPITGDLLARHSPPPGVRSWSLYTWEDLVSEDCSGAVNIRRGVGVELLPATLGLYTGADVVQGYSPMQPLGLAALFRFRPHGQVPIEQAERLLRNDLERDRLLGWMAVDRLVLGEHLHSLAPLVEANGWHRMVEAPPDAIVFARPGELSERVRALPRAQATGDRDLALARLWNQSEGPLPALLYQPGGSPESREQELAMPRLEEVREERNRVVVRIRATQQDGESVILFSRPWYPGYRAWLDGRRVPVEVLDLTLPAVRLPPGAEGELTLEYHPAGWAIGRWVCAVTATGIVFAIFVSLVRRQKRGISGSRRTTSSASNTGSSASRGKSRERTQVFQPSCGPSAPNPSRHSGTSSFLSTNCTSKSNSGPT
jgi:hypothetical protein